MLTALRNKATSWVLKILFALLILSFAVWGIGDIFRIGRGPAAVATIGPIEISGQQFMQAFRREMNRLQRLFGGNLQIEQARQLGLTERVLDDIVDRTLLDVHAGRLGIVVPDDVLLHRVEANPAFHNDQGKYDPARLELVLRQSDLSKAGFEAVMRQDIARQELIDAVTVGITVPQALVRSIYAYRAEQRIADVLVIPNDSIADMPTPDAAAIEAFYKDNGDRYRAPEYRAISVVRFSPDDFTAGVTVADDQLRQEYAARQSEFEMPERREIEQILFQDEAAAKAAADQLARGDSFEAVASAAAGGKPVSLGTVDRKQILPELADAAFGTAEGGYSAPVKSPLGWHLLHIQKVLPPAKQTLEEVRDRLAHDIARRQAADSIVSIANQFDDKLAGGASLDETVASLKLKLEKVPAIDSAGNPPEGSALPEGVVTQQVLSLAMATTEGQTSSLTETADGGYVIVRVDGLTPAAAKPLDKVRGAAIADWQAAERSKAAIAKGEMVAERVRAGENLSAIATELDLTMATSKPFTRDAGDPSTAVSATLAAKLFGVKPGEVATGPGANGHVVARLAEIVAADPKAENDLAAVRSTLQRSMTGDVRSQFSNALRQRIKVTTDKPAVDALF